MSNILSVRNSQQTGKTAYFCFEIQDLLVYNIALFKITIGGKMVKKSLCRYLLLLPVFAFVISCKPCFCAEGKADSWTMNKYMEKFKNYPQDPNFFPLTVWLQDPANAAKYKAAGINTFFALWKGPKAGQIEALKADGMYLICEMNPEALKHRDDKTIIGWMMMDEPDNFQFKSDLEVNGKIWKYGPETSRVSPKDLGEMYETVSKEDPTRPVFLGLGCGVANDQTPARGPGWKNTMYKDYIKSGDVICFDVYPVSDLGEKYLWFHAKGLDRLKEWGAAEKPRFNALGPCFTGKRNKQPSPENIKTEIWISIIHGTKGINYFCHNITPFVEDALLRDAAQLASITKINAQITELAPVINGPDLNTAAVASSSESVPIDILVKNYKGETYIFAAVMKMGEPATGTFRVKDVSAAGKVQVLGENRTLDMDATGQFKDEFKTWETHIYKVVKN